MRHLLFLLTLPALLTAQPLPLAWPNLSQGAVLYSTPTTAFGGASLPLDDSRWLLAWCDMRDGQGRLLLQTFSLDDPSAGGPWSTQVEGLGTVNALVHEPSAVTPYMPVLASDGAGGAYVLWQDMVTESYGELRLQHVGSEGSFLWPADLVVAPQVPTPEEDCRDLSERCRSWSDHYRRVVADEHGAWVFWRTVEDSLVVQRVEPTGQLDPDFPATGLALPISSYQVQALGDGQGNLLFCYQDDSPPRSRGMVLGLQPDGQYLTPAGPQVLTPAAQNIRGFQCRLVNQGQLLAGWLVDNELHTQLYDGQFRTLWDAGGVSVATDANGFAFPQSDVATAPYPLTFSTGQGWQAQSQDEEGRLLMNPAPWLDIVAGGGVGYLRGVSEDEEGLVYVHEEDQTLYVQRISPTGEQLWSADVARLGQPGTPPSIWNLQPAIGGELQLGYWSPETSCQHISRRDLQGLELLDQEHSLVLRTGGFDGTSPTLILNGPRPLFCWQGDQLYLQSVDGQSGQLGWGFLERPAARNDYWLAPRRLQTAAGVWLLNSYWNMDPPAGLLEIQRLDADGLPLTPLTVVNPVALQQPDHLDVFQSFLAAGDDDIYVGWEQWVDESTELRLQRFDSAGNRLWGDAGIAVPPTGIPGYPLAGIAAAPQGVFAVWRSQIDDTRSWYLQLFDESGHPQFMDNDGQGRLLDIPTNPWGRSVDVHALAGGRVVLESRVYSATEEVLTLLCLDTQGEELWRRQYGFVTGAGAIVETDSQGRIWLQVQLGADAERYLRVERLAEDGTAAALWRVAQNPSSYLYAQTLLFTETETALVTASQLSWSTEGMRVMGYRLDEGTETPALLFNDLLTSAHLYAWQPELSPAPNGDAWLLWRDTRGGEMYFGSQARLLRLDVLDLNSDVGPVVQPAAFRLEPNHPNPFNPETTIRFALAQAGPARLEIFNLAGQRVRVLQDGELAAGPHRLRFDARSDAGGELGSGLYFYRLSAGGESRTERMLLVR